MAVGAKPSRGATKNRKKLVPEKRREWSDEHLIKAREKEDEESLTDGVGTADTRGSLIDRVREGKVPMLTAQNRLMEFEDFRTVDGKPLEDGKKYVVVARDKTGGDGPYSRLPISSDGRPMEGGSGTAFSANALAQFAFRKANYRDYDYEIWDAAEYSMRKADIYGTTREREYWAKRGR